MVMLVIVMMILVLQEGSLNLIAIVSRLFDSLVGLVCFTGVATNCGRVCAILMRQANHRSICL